MCNKQTSQTTEITGTTDSKKQTAKVSKWDPKVLWGWVVLIHENARYEASIRSENNNGGDSRFIVLGWPYKPQNARQPPLSSCPALCIHHSSSDKTALTASSPCRHYRQSHPRARTSESWLLQPSVQCRMHLTGIPALHRLVFCVFAYPCNTFP